MTVSKITLYISLLIPQIARKRERRWKPLQSRSQRPRSPRVSTHSTRLGPHKNIRHAVNHAFESYGARFVMVLEDDVILSRDAAVHGIRQDTFENDTCVYCDWLRKQLPQGRLRRGSYVSSSYVSKNISHWFWGTWRDRWQDYTRAHGRVGMWK